MVLVLLHSVYEGRREEGGRREGKREGRGWKREGGKRREEGGGRREEGGGREGEDKHSFPAGPAWVFVLQAIKSCMRPGNTAILTMMQSHQFLETCPSIRVATGRNTLTIWRSCRLGMA